MCINSNQRSYMYYVNLHGCTFKKFVSDNMILFGMTVTFFSKICRLSFILLKQIITVNSLTSIELFNMYFEDCHCCGTQIRHAHHWVIFPGCLCPPRHIKVTCEWTFCSKCTCVWPDKHTLYLTDTTYFFIRFSSLNWRQSKMNKHTLASLNADFWK